MHDVSDSLEGNYPEIKVVNAFLPLKKHSQVRTRVAKHFIRALYDEETKKKVQ